MNYQDQLKTPMWQERRLYVLKRDMFTCTMCNQYGSQVHAHHNYYEKGKKAWEYPYSALITLCDNCHNEEHAIEHDIKEELFLAFKKSGFTNHSLIHIITGLKLLKELPASPSLTASAIGNMFASRNDFRATYENFKTNG